MKKKTALYVRVSTDAQYEEGYSVEVQSEKLEQWCKLKDVTEFEFYIDGGWSGSNLDRPEMKRMIQDIQNGKIESVIVYKLDRLSRSQKDTIYLLEDVFVPNDVSFVSLNENFDTTTSYGRAMIGILSVFAQLERDNIRERTKMGMNERIKAGYWRGGGGVPYGYDYDKTQDILVPNADAENVKKIYQLYLQGYSPNKIAEMYHFSCDAHVRNMLDRVTYCGKMLHNGEIIEGKHAAIIDQATWDEVQQQRLLRKTNRETDATYLFTGLLVCGKCGAKMRYQKWGKRVKIYCYSQQKSKKSMIVDPNCDNLKIDAEDLEPMILEDLFSRTDAIFSGPRKTEPVQSSLQILKDTQKELITRQKRLYNLYGSNGDEILLETIEEVKEQIRTLQKAIDNEIRMQRELKKNKEAQEMVRNLRSKWPTLTDKEKRQAIRLCIKEIVITDREVRVTYLI